MNDKRQMTDTDEELIDTLLAISVVSKRLARNLSILAAQSKATEGGKTDEQNERAVRDHRRTAQVCNELERVRIAISDAANWLAEQFNGNEPEPEATPAEPVLTLEAVRAVLAEKSRAGFTAQIRSLLQKYGADKLSGIDPANYGALLADVEAIGVPEESTDSLGRGGAAE